MQTQTSKCNDMGTKKNKTKKKTKKTTNLSKLVCSNGEQFQIQLNFFEKKLLYPCNLNKIDPLFGSETVIFLNCLTVYPRDIQLFWMKRLVKVIF